jgi:alpha-1,6-mannosyltransferase
VPWEGLVGAVAIFIAVAAAAEATNAAMSPIDPPGAWRPVWIVAVATSFAAYLAGVVRIRRSRVSLLAVLAVASVIQLAPLFGPLLFSTDVYSYWDYGRLAAVHHVNPYQREPSQVLKPTDLGYGEGLGTAIYGPVFTAAAEVHARVVGTSLRLAEILYRVAAAVAVLVLLLILARYAPSPTRAVAFVGWNPLIALHFGGGGHNDIWMLLFVVIGLLLTRNDRPRAGGIGWAASAFVKASMVALLPLELSALARRSRRAARLLFVSVTATSALLALLSTTLYGTAWPSFIHRASTQLSQTSSLSLVFRMQQHGVSTHTAKGILAAAFVLGYLALLVDAWRCGRPRLALAGTLLILTPAWLVPWYGSWPVVLNAVDDDTAGEIAALAATAYLLTDAVPVSLF